MIVKGGASPRPYGESRVLEAMPEVFNLRQNLTPGSSPS